MAGTPAPPTRAFPDLTEAEQALAAAWAAGEAWVGEETDGEKPVIRAAVLRHLILGDNPAWPAAPGMLRIGNARITGALDLANLAGRATSAAPLPALGLFACTFAARVDLSNARLVKAFFRRCDLNGLDCSGAQIEGDLDLSGSTLSAADGVPALFADGAEIGGNVFLTPQGGHRFEAKGTMRLLGARIGGILSARGARLDGCGGDALSADGAEIRGDVVLISQDGDRFESKGEVRLLGVRIGGDLSANGARLDGGGGDALSADRAEIEGSVFLRPASGHRFESKGAVRLPGARIGGGLSVNGARMDGGEGYALSADGADIGSVFLTPGGDHRFEAKGAVRFPAARIAGAWQARDTDIDGAMDMTGAHVRELRDHPRTGWPEAAGRLDLDRFTYEAIENADVGARLAWLGRQYGAAPCAQDFKPQPYEQLARVLRAQGHGEAADEVAIAKRDMSIRCKADRWLTRQLTRFMGRVAGHGYRPARALRWTASWWAAGFVLMSAALVHGDVKFKPASPYRAAASVDYVAPGWGKSGFSFEHVWARDDDGCLPANVPLYALELLVPVIELGQDSACHMESEGTVGGVVQAVRALYQIVGFILVAILGATLTGLLRKD